MDEQLKIAKDVLKKYNQEHLLAFYDELNSQQKLLLLNKIVTTDFGMLQMLFNNSKKDDSIRMNRISPLSYTVKSELSDEEKNKYSSLGITVIKNNELAVITLAGGQGTRLGYRGPKGCYEIDFPPKKSLFELTCQKLKEAFKKYNVYIHWYIMTSPSNDLLTKKYFEEKNYFNYPKAKISFFVQDTLPIIDVNGKVILDNIYTIKEASNGNGDVFRAFNHAKLLNSLISSNVKWISLSGIDNILLDLIDPLFIGLTISNNSPVGSKSVKKTKITSPDWIFALVDNAPSIISPSNLSHEMLFSKNNKGFYNYNQSNILAHLFSVDYFASLANVYFPYHRAFKKNDYINDEGMKVVPSAPNTFKFEKFIFDGFKYCKNLTLLEVEANKEFAPI